MRVCWKLSREWSAVCWVPTVHRLVAPCSWHVDCLWPDSFIFGGRAPGPASSLHALNGRTGVRSTRSSLAMEIAMDDPVAERRKEWARMILQRADLLHREIIDAQERELLTDTFVPKAKVTAKPEMRKTKPVAVRAAEEEVRLLRQRAARAKERLALANHQQPPSSSRRQRAATPIAETPPSAGMPERSEETAARQRAELRRLKATLAAQEREVAALRERDIALAGVLCALGGDNKSATKKSAAKGGSRVESQPPRSHTTAEERRERT